VHAPSSRQESLFSPSPPVVTRWKVRVVKRSLHIRKNLRRCPHPIIINEGADLQRFSPRPHVASSFGNTPSQPTTQERSRQTLAMLPWALNVESGASAIPACGFDQKRLCSSRSSQWRFHLIGIFLCFTSAA